MFDDQVDNAAQQESVETTQEAQPQEEAQETQGAKNFRQLKEQKERAERERDEALRIAQEMQTRLKQGMPTEAPEDDNVYLNPDDIAEGKHLSKVQKKISKLEQKLHQYEQQTAAVSIETQLRSRYPDFEQVVSTDTINTLKDQYPEIAATIQNSPDLYSKAVSAYTIIKKMGIYSSDTFNKEKELAQKNTIKPKPMASISPQQGDTPLSHANAFANGLTDELRKQLLREMNEARKGY